MPDGTSVLAAGLDHWYEREEGSGGSQATDIDEFRVEEWRLQQALKVNHFRLPPDYRWKRPYGEAVPNLKLTIPFVRFPQWNFCPRCYRLQDLPLSFRGREQCVECRAEKRKAPLVAQVPFIAICEYGHIQDFPWREWVHAELTPACNRPIRLRSTGGASLAAQVVECDCGKKRVLAQITDAAPLGSSKYPQTYLSSNLTNGGPPYLCKGITPWHGSDSIQGCDMPLRGSLRAASNVYFALVESSIYLPRATSGAPEDLIQLLVNPPLSTLIHLLQNLGSAVTPEILRNQHRDLLQPFTDEQVQHALDEVAAQAATSMTEPEVASDSEDEEPEGTGFRRQEFEVLRREQQSSQLAIREPSLHEYDSRITKHIQRIMLVDQLRETRALFGFNRIFPEGPYRLRDRKALLWKDQPDWKDNWLPAYVVHGEGIFAELDEGQLAAWEQRPTVIERADRLAKHYEGVQKARGLRRQHITPRSILLHTLAHLLINQLTYECGYSSAALRERLYIAGGASPMAGILIYTAAGDAEGTMGGLVRMGKPGYFEPALLAALEGAQWCSADPVCMEISQAGQGPDSCNLAACHNCALVPETACEKFNRFLDRALVIGSHTDEGLGFFSSP
jgi:hypothetical protein